MIAGLESPTGGTIELDGQDVTKLHPSRRDVGFVFQFYALYPHWNVAENIAFPLRWRDWNARPASSMLPRAVSTMPAFPRA